MKKKYYKVPVYKVTNLRFYVGTAAQYQMENIGDVIIERTIFTGFFTPPKEISTNYDGFLPMAQYYQFRPTVENTPDIYATKTTPRAMNEMIDEFGYGLAINQIDYFNEENRATSEDIMRYLENSQNSLFYQLYSDMQRIAREKEQNQAIKRRK